MPVELETIIQAIENLGGRARAKNISPEVAKLMNADYFPQPYRSYSSFYGTVQGKIEEFCPQSDNYEEGTEKIFERVGHGIYSLYNNKKIEKVYYSIENDAAIEGYKKDRTILSSSRNQKLSKERKKLDDYKCQSCGFRLSISDKFVIECHHLNPLAENGTVETLIEDLVSLCPTCHRIAHLRQPPYTPIEVSNIIKNV